MFPKIPNIFQFLMLGYFHKFYFTIYRRENHPASTIHLFRLLDGCHITSCSLAEISDVITCLLNFNMKKKQLFLLKFQNILIMLLGSQNTNNALFLDLFLSIFRKTYWVKQIPNKNFGHHFFMPTFAFSCRGRLVPR